MTSLILVLLPRYPDPLYKKPQKYKTSTKHGEKHDDNENQDESGIQHQTKILIYPSYRGQICSFLRCQYFIFLGLKKSSSFLAWWYGRGVP